MCFHLYIYIYIYIYIHNKYTQYMHIYYVNKNVNFPPLILIYNLNKWFAWYFFTSLCVNIAVVANGAKQIKLQFICQTVNIRSNALWDAAARTLSLSQHADTFLCSSRTWPQTLNCARSWITSMWCTWRIKRTATCCVTCRATTTAPSAGRSAHTCRCTTPSESQTPRYSEGAKPSSPAESLSSL